MTKKNLTAPSPERDAQKPVGIDFDFEDLLAGAIASIKGTRQIRVIL